MTTHDLKSWPGFYNALLDGTKTFDARRNDRNFQVGDTLIQHEWIPSDPVNHADGRYTGRTMRFTVTYILRGEEAPAVTGIVPGFCVMGLKAV